MKQEMLIKSLEQLLDHLHMMPDSETDKTMKSMMGDLPEEKEEEGEVEVVKMKAELPLKKEMLGGKAEKPFKKVMEDMEEVKVKDKPKGLFEMISKQDDDPDMEEYMAKKKRAKDAWMASKG